MNAMFTGLSLFCWIILSVFVLSSEAQFNIGHNCDEVLVTIAPDRDPQLKDFPYHEILGRYTLNSSSLALSRYTQLHGRHDFEISLQKPTDILDLKNHQEQLIFAASDPIKNLSVYVGVHAYFKKGYTFFLQKGLLIDAMTDISDNIDTFHVYDDFNLTFVEYTTPGIRLMCMSPEFAKLVPTCTDERSYRESLSFIDTNETLNDPATDTFTLKYYIDDKPYFGHSRGYLTMYYEQPIFDVDLGWLIYLTHPRSSGYVRRAENALYPLPEMVLGSWTGVGQPLDHLISCTARLDNCSQCNSENTDRCSSQPSVWSSADKFYCTCKLGYKGETCDMKAAKCTSLPHDIFGDLFFMLANITEYYEGEVVNVWCYGPYDLLMSKTNYPTTCNPDGTWSKQRDCLKYSILSDIPNPRSLNDTELLRALISKVEKIIGPVRTPPQWLKELGKVEIILSAVFILFNLPLILVICHLFIYRCLRGLKRSKAYSIISIYCYVFMLLYFTYSVVGFVHYYNLLDFLHSTSLITISCTFVYYIVYIVMTFNSREYRAISNLPKLELGEYLSQLVKDAPEVKVTAECYHDEVRTKNVKKYIERENANRRMVLERSVDVDVPVVTQFYVETCPVFFLPDIDDQSYAIKPLANNKITTLDLELEVKLGDQESIQVFEEMKMRMLNDYKGLDEKINMFTEVTVPGFRNRVHGRTTLNIPLYGRLWFFRLFTIFLMGGFLRLLVSKNLLKTVKYKIVKVIYLHQNRRIHSE